MEKDSNFRCVECGFPIKRLYIQYSPGNIRLKKCENCKNVADEYIECELMIIVIDLILHKPKAYRHLFSNMFSKDAPNFEGLLWGSALGYLLLDVYTIWFLNSSQRDWISIMRFASLWRYYGKILISIVVGNLAFILILLIGSAKFLNVSAAGFGWKHIVLGVLFSSYFKIFLVAMMVWEFPYSMVFMIDIFILSSNTVALKELSLRSISSSRSLDTNNCNHRIHTCVVMIGRAGKLTLNIHQNRKDPNLDYLLATAANLLHQY